MTFDGAGPLLDRTTERMVEREIESLGALAGLNRAFLGLLRVWAGELGVPVAAQVFGLRVSTLSRLLFADDDVARAPFSFATVDPERLLSTPPTSAPAGGHVTERHRLVDVVQALFVSVLGSYGDGLAGLEAVFGQPQHVLRQVPARHTAWLGASRRWIVASPWLDLWVIANRLDSADRYRVVTAVLQRERPR